MTKRAVRCRVPIAILVMLASVSTSHVAPSAALSGPTDIGTLGGTYSRALAVNDAGQVVGTSTIAGDAEWHAFSWTQAGGMVDLGVLAGNNSYANAVNASGQVVGGSTYSASRANHAFSWTQAGGMVDLGTLGGSSDYAQAVNDAGQVVGSSNLAGDGASHGFSWTQSGGMVDLGSFGGSFGEAQDVNASGQVAGTSTLVNYSQYHAYLWTQSGGKQDLGTLGNPSSQAFAVNDSGQVVGYLFGGTVNHAFSWTQAGGMVDLGTLGGNSSYAQAVNGAGQVAGTSATTGDSPSDAFLWTQAGGMVDLGTLGGNRSDASAVNASGLAVGEAQTASGENHAAVWHVGPAVPGSADQVVTGGDVVDTDTGGVGPTPAVPVQTRVVVPAGVNGELSITPQDPTAPPAGFAFFGKQVVIVAPPATGPAAPYIATFSIDASALGGIAPADVQVFRNGVPVADCTDASQAIPDPCVAARGLVSGGAGDAFVTVRTTHFSTWSVGRFAYTPSGFFAPVDNLPTINTVKAGSAVPVKFGLGGNRGLNVLVAGSPSSVLVACGSGPSDAIEQTTTAGASSLSYDAGSARYQYVWKTDKAWVGCRDLVVRFRDGSTLRARFSFK